MAEDETGEVGEFPARLPSVNLTGPAVGTLPVLGDGAGDPLGPGIAVPPVQLGLLSQEAFGTPLLWKDLLQYNDIDDPASFIGPLSVLPVGLSQR